MLGERVAIGRTSEVFAYGNDSVAKVLQPNVPEQWASVEATFTRAVRALDVPAPDVRDVTVIDGRPAVIFERVVGESMWEQMVARPSDAPALVRDFVEVQRVIHRAGVPVGVPALVERMSAKIDDVASLDPADRAAACDLVASLPRGAALLHGDLHPGNVLVGPTGLVVIDWFDATVGHPVADVLRSSLLVTSRDATDLRHLPGVEVERLDRIHDDYLAAMDDVLSPQRERLDDWRAVIAVSRLAERTDLDDSGLRATWARRRVSTSH